VYDVVLVAFEGPDRYSFVGGLATRMIDLAAFYAAVANEGALPQPHGIDSIEENGQTVYEYPKTPLPWIGAADRASFYQLKTMLQGVVARGTARAIAPLSPYMAGKTGTTSSCRDAWFVGFTPRRNPDIVVCVLFQGGEHGRLAARLATQVIKAYVDKQHRTPQKMVDNPKSNGAVDIGGLWTVTDSDGDKEKLEGGGFVFALPRMGQFSPFQMQSMPLRPTCCSSRKPGSRRK